MKNIIMVSDKGYLNFLCDHPVTLNTPATSPRRRHNAATWCRQPDDAAATPRAPWAYIMIICPWINQIKAPDKGVLQKINSVISTKRAHVTMTRLNRLAEKILVSTHNSGFRTKNNKTIPSCHRNFHPISSPDQVFCIH